VTHAIPSGVRRVALGGGCLVNRLLHRALTAGLEQVHLEPITARELPCGDGGLAYGQAVLAALSLSRGSEPSYQGA